MRLAAEERLDIAGKRRCKEYLQQSLGLHKAGSRQGSGDAEQGASCFLPLSHSKSRCFRARPLHMSRHDVLSINVLKSAMIQKAHFLDASMLREPCCWCAGDGDALVVFVGRLAHQKGVDLIAHIIPWIMTPDHSYVTGRAQVLLFLLPLLPLLRVPLPLPLPLLIRQFFPWQRFTPHLHRRARIMQR
jgi:glycosyltransferase involved in cell wall biosynthesis